MMRDKLLTAMAVALFIFLGAPAMVCADLRPEPIAEQTDIDLVFIKYFSYYEKFKEDRHQDSEPGVFRPTKSYECPGYIAGEWAEKPDDLFCEAWPYRAKTYEIFFPTKKDIARAIYGLALFTRDLKPSVTLERFERGAGGFHYSIDQIAGWANAVMSGSQKVYTEEEQDFLDRLLADRVLLKVNGRYVSIGLVNHVLGVAPMKKRSLVLNLNHERTHVMWDEDPSFKERSIAGWRSLSQEEKDAVYNQLKGYSKENELQIIEEWAVRKNEAKPMWLSKDGGRG